MNVKKRFFSLVLMIVLVAVLITGCQPNQKKQYARGSSASFLKLAARDITLRKEDPGIFFAGSNRFIDVEGEPYLQPYFAMLDFKASVDSEDKELVHYSCRVPGAITLALNMTFETCYTNVSSYSPWVDVEGTVRILKNENGERQIDVSKLDNIFGAYVLLRYANETLYSNAGIDISGGVTNENRKAVFNRLASVGGTVYALALGEEPEKYMSEVVVPEAEAIKNAPPATFDLQDRAGYGFLNHYYALPVFVRWLISAAGVILIFILLLILMMILTRLAGISGNKKAVRKSIQVRYANNEEKRREMERLSRDRRYRGALYEPDSSKRLREIRKLSCPADQAVLEFLVTDSSWDVRETAVEKLPWPECRETITLAAEHFDSGKAIAKIPYPQEQELLRRIAREGETTRARLAALERLDGEADRETIAYIARTAENKKLRMTALEKLPAEDSADALIEIFRKEENYEKKKEILKKIDYTDSSADFLRDIAKSGAKDSRRIALEKLPYKDTVCRQILLQTAGKEEPDADLRRVALDRLPYPEEREFLAEIALGDADDNLRYHALQKFSYPKEKNLFVQAAQKDPDWENRRLALEKLTWQDAPQALREIVLKDENAGNRRLALEKIPPAKERGIYEKVARSDTDGALRLLALKELTWEDDPQALQKIAVKDKEAKNRRLALEKIPPAKGRETYEKAAVSDKDQELRRLALKELTYPASRDALVKISCHDEESELRRIAREKTPWLEEPEPWAHIMLEPWLRIGSGPHSGPTDDDRIKATIALTRHPVCTEEILKHLCIRIQGGMHSDHSSPYLTSAGWAAAALGRILAGEMSPDDIPENRKRLQPAMEHHNEIVGKLRELQDKLRPYEGRQRSSLPSFERDAVDNMMRQADEYRRELDRGLGYFMLENGDRPLAYLTHLLRDNQTRVPRFIKQGVIMGLVDWLSDNASHPEAKQLLETVISVRADLIRSDDNLSFFELRVPSDCTQEEYAAVLADVLHSANPSVKFCDTKELLTIAQEEVPGCMEMLRVCPLRLIDPVNRQTLGFYKFEPYVHAMWTQYQPPINTGKVLNRYHEVDDRTKPLSSGLNLQLFRDPWAVIPTIFHEYQHYKGDPNEASVFLKTQMFSIAFYKKYRSANARADGVFAQMTSMLGLPPAAEKISALNDTIEKYYGKQRTKEEAEVHVKNELSRLNIMIDMANRSQTWDRDIRFPLFAKGEDEKNRDLISDILTRFDTVPKSITTEQFNGIVSQGKEG